MYKKFCSSLEDDYDLDIAEVKGLYFIKIDLFNIIYNNFYHIQLDPCTVLKEVVSLQLLIAKRTAFRYVNRNKIIKATEIHSTVSVGGPDKG